VQTEGQQFLLAIVAIGREDEAETGVGFSDMDALHTDLLGVKDAIHFAQHGIDVASGYLVAGDKHLQGVGGFHSAEDDERDQDNGGGEAGGKVEASARGHSDASHYEESGGGG